MRVHWDLGITLQTCFKFAFDRWATVAFRAFLLFLNKKMSFIRKECAISHTKNHSLCFRYLKLRKFQVEIATVSAIFFSDKCLTALYRNRVTWNHDSQSKLVFIVFYPHSHDQIQIMYCLYGKNSKNYLFLQPLNK